MHVKVFISYSHDSEEHKNDVWELSARLRNEGIESIIDQYEDSPRDGWPLWCEKQIRDADFVLINCTKTYLQRVMKEELPGTGLGVTYETEIIRNSIYDSGCKIEKYIPIVFFDTDFDFIPLPLRSTSRYIVSNDEGFKALTLRLTGQKPSAPAIGLFSSTASSLSIPTRKAGYITSSIVMHTIDSILPSKKSNNSVSTFKKYFSKSNISDILLIIVFIVFIVFANNLFGTIKSYYNAKSKFNMVKIDSGTFNMGSDLYKPDERPVHKVFINKFWISGTEITQGQYSKVMSKYYKNYTNPKWSSTLGIGTNYPVYWVTWYDAILFCNALTKDEGSTDTVYSFNIIYGIPGNGCTALTGLTFDTSKSGYRLPTEAEWEFACRAGTSSENFVGDSVNGNIVLNLDLRAHPVGNLKPNNWNLYDMLGNVAEWCNDWYNPNFYSISQIINPLGPDSGEYKCFRGGSWSQSHLRSIGRIEAKPSQAYYDIGFRCARSIKSGMDEIN